MSEERPYCPSCGGELRRPGLGPGGMLFLKKSRRKGRRAGRRSGSSGLDIGLGFIDTALRFRGRRTLGGIVFTAVCFVALLFSWIVLPAASGLSVDFKIKAPEGVKVEAGHTHSMKLGGRRSRKEWRIEIDAKVHNQTEQALRIGSVTAEMRKSDGRPILNAVSEADLLAESGVATPILFLRPGESRRYRTASPFYLRADAFDTRLKCVIRVERVSRLDPDLLGDLLRK